MIRRFVAAVAGVLGLLAGLWLVLAPFALGNQPAGRDWTRPTTVTVATGGAVALVGLAGFVAATAALFGVTRRYGTAAAAGPTRHGSPGARDSIRDGSAEESGPIRDGLVEPVGSIREGSAEEPGSIQDGLPEESGPIRDGSAETPGSGRYRSAEGSADPAPGVPDPAVGGPVERETSVAAAPPPAEMPEPGAVSPADLLSAVLPALVADLTAPDRNPVDRGPLDRTATGGTVGGTVPGRAVPAGATGRTRAAAGPSAEAGKTPIEAGRAAVGPAGAEDATIGRFPRRPVVGVNGYPGPAWSGFLHPGHEHAGGTVADAVHGRDRAVQCRSEVRRAGA
ncbi:hypothetical protein Athai_59870 [Actinocatenispora thailandica]|uniref:Uncharacterized protein n=1 Tax=Actinocatenispora thailandica TaxID=227318 RepID=A0A7R7DV92_9ACTN|nr:hypothetical protein [Actinocatenispora thailandica]BCJ38484.1 hypothetical protein Athai_59870 [Actinocatenispora thailandica]